MTGIEAAGLILGALPLVIAAVERYRQSAEVLGNFWKFKRSYQKCMRELEYLQLAFSANLQELLLPLICDDGQIMSLMSDPGGPAWQGEELEGKLQGRLSTAYELYIHSMEDIKEVVQQLGHELDVEKLGEASTEVGLLESTKSGSMQLAQRTKFALGQSNREKLFEEFTKYNDRLRELLRTSDQLTQIKTSRNFKDRSMVKSTSVIWKRAATLYKLLYNAWGCSCQASHRANLRLQECSTDDLQFSFDVMFSHSILSDITEKPWHYRNTNIVVVKTTAIAGEICQVPSNVSSPLSHISPPNTFSPTKAGKYKSSFFRKVITKRTTFADDPMIHLSQATTLVSVQSSSPNLDDPQDNTNDSNDQPPLKEIDTLCNTLHIDSDVHSSACYGILKSGEEDYQIFPLSREKQSKGAEMLSLKDLLEQKTDIKLSRRQRYGLATALALSYIQLHSTPWLTEDWDKAHILFFRVSSDCKTTLLDQPRLSTDFKSPFDIDMTREKSNRDLKALGILLIELCFGCTLENTEVRQKYPFLAGSGNAYLDQAAAIELCAHVADEAGPEYLAAVQWCLNWNPSKSASDTEWRTELYDNVVKPLRQCHGHLI